MRAFMAEAAGIMPAIHSLQTWRAIAIHFEVAAKMLETECGTTTGGTWSKSTPVSLTRCPKKTRRRSPHDRRHIVAEDDR